MWVLSLSLSQCVHRCIRLCAKEYTRWLDHALTKIRPNPCLKARKTAFISFTMEKFLYLFSLWFFVVEKGKLLSCCLEKHSVFVRSILDYCTKFSLTIHRELGEGVSMVQSLKMKISAVSAAYQCKVIWYAPRMTCPPTITWLLQLYLFLFNTA